MFRIVPLLSLCLCASVASAQTPVATPAAASESNAEMVVSATDAKKSVEKKNDRNCLRVTGSRIAPRNKDACLNASGRSYGREDIERTGAITIADALQRLDPAVTVGR